MITDIIESNIQKALELILQYEKAKDLNAYMDIYEKLSLYSVYLGENASSLKTEYNRSYYRRKIAVSHSFLANKREKISERQSLEMANTENEDLLEEEMEAEALAVRLEVFLRQINKVLDAMRSRVSHEKGERNRIMPGDI